MRCSWEISSTAHTRISLTWPSRLICTASSRSCAITTPARSVRDLCREGIATMGENEQAGFLAEAFIEIFEQRAAACEHDAAVADVCGKFGRGALESHAAGVQNRRQAFGKG